MKIELVKEYNFKDNTTIYSVEVDGQYLSGTCTSDLQQCETFYKSACDNKGVLNLNYKETLLSHEIND